MDSYGQLRKADFENLAGDPTPASRGRIYFNTGSSRLRMYNGTAWVDLTIGPLSPEIANVSIAASVASNALTVSLKQANGDDCTTNLPGYISFRSATATTGSYVRRAITAATSVVVSSGSTLGHASGIQHNIYVYAIDNGGTVELAVSNILFDEGSTVSTTAEGGAGGADSNRVMYSTTARSGVACRLLARLTSTQATAGTWVTAISEIANVPFEKRVIGFRAHSSTTNWDGASNTAIFTSKTYDSENGYNTSTGIYTVPKAGLWEIGAALGITAANMTTNTSSLKFTFDNNGTGLGGFNIGGTLGGVSSVGNFTRAYRAHLQAVLAAGDPLKIILFNNDAAATLTGGTDATYFWMTYLGQR